MKLIAGLFQSGYSLSTHLKRDSQITRSKISYSLIEPQSFPCTTACGYKFQAFAIHPPPTFTPHSCSPAFVGSR